MKLVVIIILAAFVGVSLASPLKLVDIRQPVHGVNADDLRVPLNRLLENIDLIELDRVVREIFETDQGGIFLLYLRGAGFGRILDTLAGEAEVNNILDYITENGISDIRQFIDQLLSDLGIERPPPTIKLIKNQVSPNASFEELLVQLGACFDQEGLYETALDIANTDPSVWNFLNYLAREECGPAWQRIKNQADFASLLNLLTAAGLDVDSIIAQLEALFGWGAEI